MALPTQKHTKSRQRKKKLSLALKKVRFVNCPQCSKPLLPHHACTFCGVYAGQAVLKIKSKKDKKNNKRNKKE